MLLSTTSLLVLFFLIPQATGTPQETRLSVDNTTGDLQRRWCCRQYLSFPPFFFLSNIIAGNRNALMQDSLEFVIVVSALPQARRKLKNNNNNSTAADTGVIGARSCLKDWGVEPVEWRNRNNKEQGGCPSRWMTMDRNWRQKRVRRDWIIDINILPKKQLLSSWRRSTRGGINESKAVQLSCAKSEGRLIYYLSEAAEGTKWESI